MSNERKTENMLEQALKKSGFNDIDFQFQGSDDDEIQRCLPSKKTGRAGLGKPEHIIRLNGDAADLLITECKLLQAEHASASDLTEDSPLKPSKYAEDGVLHYMKGLRKEFNVIGLAVSGLDPLCITTFKALRGGRIERLTHRTTLKREDYLAILRQSDGYGEKSETEIMEFAHSLHEYLRDSMELSESLKPLIVSGILLALKNPSFEAGYRATSDKDDLAENLVSAIRQTLRSNKIKDEKIKAMMSGYDFIRVNKSVKMHLMGAISRIYRHLFFALQPNNSLDLLGNFYGEFLRYSGGDQQGLGIVLTPRHITELFADLADLDPSSSVVLDTCTGTSGYLISSMAHMLQKAQGNSELISRIKNKALIGIELDQHMFTLACANMIFRGDGKSNMYWDDCLQPREPETEQKVRSLKPNVAMLNPPYSKGKKDKQKSKHELRFIERSLDLLEPGGISIAIVPVGALIDESKAVVAIKKDILDRHTLRAVMSMPPQLFPNVGTVTAIVVFEAHRPHHRKETRPAIDDETGKPIMTQDGKAQMVTIESVRSETWFGYWRDDGFVMSKNKRFEREPGSWEKTKTRWLDAYFNQRITVGESCRKAVSFEDEWVAEAYLETDYSTLTQEDFEKEVKKFSLYNLMLDIQGSEISEAEEHEA